MATTISLLVSFDITQMNRIPALRWRGEIARNIQGAKNLFALLQKICPDLGELALLLGGNNRPRLIEPVGDQVVQFLPVIQLQRQQPKLGLDGFVSHAGPVAESSRVSSSFCKLS